MTARRRAPPSVWVSTASFVVVIVAQAALVLVFARPGQVGWAMYAFAAVLWALLVAGLLRGSRLAWLWGRWLGLVLGALVAAAALAGAMRGEMGWAAIAATLLGIAVPLLVASLALGRRSAYGFFDLVCPACAARTGIGADLFFRQARCATCRNVW